MDELQQLYGLFDSNNLLGGATIDDFRNADDNQKKQLYDLLKSNNIDGGVDYDTFSTAWAKKKSTDSASEGQDLVSKETSENGLLATPQGDKGQLVKDIDAGKFDDRIEELQAENDASEKEQKKREENQSFTGELLRSFRKGSSRLGRNIAAVPELLYDVFAIPQNALGIESISTDSEKFKDYIGVDNVIKDYYSTQIDNITLEQQEKDKVIIGDITTNIKNGNYTDSFRLIGKSVSESLPSTIGIALSGGSASAPQVLTGVTTVFGSDSNEEYKKESPEMDANERTIKSLGKGFAEGVFSTVGSSKIGVAAKQIITKEGKEEGAKILKTQLVNLYTEALKKYPIPSAMIGEGIEEAATQMTQNAIDGKPIMQGVSDSFIVGTASGGVFGLGLEGIKQISKGNTSPKDIESVESTIEKQDVLKAELTEQVKGGDLKPTEAKEIYDNWEEIKNDLQAVPEEFTPEQKAKSIDLIKEKKQIENSISGKEPSLVEDKKARIEEINNELKNINAKTKESTKETTKPKVEAIAPETEVESKETIETNSDEKQAQGDTTTNGDVSSGTIKSEKQGEVENIPPTVDGNTSESKVELKRINPDGVKGEFDYSLNDSGNVDKIYSAKDGRELPKFVEVTRNNGTKYVKRNGNYTKIESAVTGAPTENQQKDIDKAEKAKNLERFEPTTPEEHALNFFARGGKLDPKSAKDETGYSDKELKWATLSNKGEKLQTIDAVAESIVENSQQDLDVFEVKNALLDALQSNENKSQVEEKISNFIKDADANMQEAELYAFKNSLNEKELANFESQVAEDKYIRELSDEDVEAYYNEKLDNYEQGQQATIQESNDTGRETTVKGDEATHGKSEQNSESIQEGRSTSSKSKGRVNELTRILRGKGKDDGRSLGKSRENQSQQEDRLKEYAKQNNLWLEEKDIIANSAEKYPSGKEADIYVSKDGKSVTKIVNYKKYSKTPLDFIENRVSLFNQLFPETAYSISGITETNNGISFVLEQPRIRGSLLSKIATLNIDLVGQQNRIRDFIKEKFGYDSIGLDAYGDGNIRIEDLHLKNVIEGIDGNLYVIDAITSSSTEASKNHNDDIQAQGVSLSKENNRDSALSDEGAVKAKNETQRRWKRFWNNTFSSKRGLDNSVVRTVESLFVELSAINEGLKYEASQFAKISKQIKRKDAKNYNTHLKNINAYLSGDTSVDLSFLTDVQRDNLDAFRGRIDTLSDKITDKLKQRRKKLKSEEAIKRIDALIETIEANKGNYLFRQYDAFSNPKYLNNLTSKYPNAAGKKRLNNAINFVAKDQDISFDEAKTQILTYLDDLKGSGSYVGASATGKAKAPFLKRRKEIPQEIRELLGESKDPVKNYIATVYNMSNYIANLEYQSKMAQTLESLGLASDTMQPGYTKLVKSTEGWDLLQDIYVPDKVAEGIADLQPLESIQKGFYKILVQASSYVKLGKTVLSPITMSRNFLSGVFLGLNNGFNPLLNPKLFAQGIAHSWGTKKTNTDLRAENQRLIKLGIIKDGAVSREVLGILNDAKLPIDQILSKNVLNKFLDVMQKLYAMGDDAYKVVSFYVWEGRYKKAGYTPQQAEDMAVDRVRNGFPTYSKIPKNIQKLRRIPLIGTFPSFTYEVFRTNLNNIRFIGQDLKQATNKDLSDKKRLAHAKMAYKQISGMALATSMAYALSELSKSLIGVSDEEDETTRNMSAPWQKDSKNIYVGKQGNNYELIDATAFFPQETILKPLRILTEERQGRDINDKISLSLKAATDAFFGTDIFMKTIEELHMNKNSYGTEIYEGDNLMQGISNDKGKIANYILKQAGPGIYNNIAEFARANEIAPDFFGDKETSYKEYTNQEALLALTGIRLSRINYANGIKSIGFDSKDEYKDKRANLLQSVKSSRTFKEDELKEAFNNYKKDNSEVHKKIILAVNGAKKQGMKPETIKKALKGAGYSKKDIKTIIEGNTPELKEITKASLRNKFNSIEIGRFSKDKNKVNSEIKNIQQKTDFLNNLIKEHNKKHK